MITCSLLLRPNLHYRTVGELEKRLAAAESALDTSLGVGSGSGRQEEDGGDDERASHLSSATSDGASVGKGSSAGAAAPRASAFKAGAAGAIDAERPQEHGGSAGDTVAASRSGRDSDTGVVQQLQAERMRSARYADRVRRCERRVAQLESLIRGLASGHVKLPNADHVAIAAVGVSTGEVDQADPRSSPGVGAAAAPMHTCTAVGPDNTSAGSQGASGAPNGLVRDAAVVAVPCSHCAELQVQVWRLQQVRPVVLAARFEPRVT